MDIPTYLHLPTGSVPPKLQGGGYFKAVVIVEDDVSPSWQDLVSDWLVRSGCRYMVAWGRHCSKWDDSVDHANLSLFGYGEIPEDDFVMTTWHEDESLLKTFWYAAFATTKLLRTYIVHIAQGERETELLELYRQAQNSPQCD